MDREEEPGHLLGPGHTHSGDVGDSARTRSGIASLSITAGPQQTGMSEALLDVPPDQQPTAFKHPIPVWKRRYMVGIFSLMAALLFSDQNLLAPNLTQAANDFGFDESQRDALLGGVIMASFFVVGAPSALLVGWLTDKVNRRNLLCTVVLMGSAPGLATYWVTEFWQLVILRTLTGISVGGTFPLVYSLLGDLFPISQRSAVSAFVLCATGGGVALGQGLASLTGGENWRIPFVIIAIPSIVMAVIMVLTAEEPPRGAFEEALEGAYAEGDEYKETITWPKVKALLRIPTNWLIITQGLPGSLPWGMMLTFFNDFLSQNKGLSIQYATLVILLFGLGGAVGVIGGGAAGQMLYNRRKEYVGVLMGTCVLLGISPFYYLVNAPLAELSMGGTCVMAIIGGMLSGVAGPNVRAVMMNVNDPETRGVAFALQTTTDDLGKGLGPVIVAGFIQTLGRTAAFNLAIAGWIPCAILLFSLVFCLRKDEAAMQARLRLKVDQSQACIEGSGDDQGFINPDPDSSNNHTALAVNGANGGARHGPNKPGSSAGHMGGDEEGMYMVEGGELVPPPPGPDGAPWGAGGPMYGVQGSASGVQGKGSGVQGSRGKGSHGRVSPGSILSSGKRRGSADAEGLEQQLLTNNSSHLSDLAELGTATSPSPSPQPTAGPWGGARGPSPAVQGRPGSQGNPSPLPTSATGSGSGRVGSGPSPSSSLESGGLVPQLPVSTGHFMVGVGGQVTLPGQSASRPSSRASAHTENSRDPLS